MNATHRVNVEPSYTATTQSNYNTIQCIVALLKGILGAGILSLPYAVQQSGVMGCIVGSIVLGIMSSMTMKQLVYVKHVIYGTSYVNYSELVDSVLGRQAGTIVCIALLSSSIGVCTSYVAWCVSTLSVMVAPYIASYQILLILMCTLIILTLVRSARRTSLIALIGNTGIILSMLSVLLYGSMYCDVRENIHDIVHSNDMLIHGSSYGLFISISTFSYAIHFFVLPIERQVNNIDNFNSAVNWSYIIGCSLSCLFGIIAYLMFGNNIKSIILQNLPDIAVTIFIKLLLVLSMLMSYTIVITPSIQLIESIVSAHIGSRADTLVRIALVIITIIFAALVPTFVIIASLIGGISMVSLAFIFPVLMRLRLDTVQYKSNKQTSIINNNQYIKIQPLTYIERVIQYFIIMFAIAVIINTIIDNTLNIIQLYQSKQHIFTADHIASIHQLTKQR